MLNQLGAEDGSSTRALGWTMIALVPLGFLVGLATHWALEEEKKKAIDRMFAHRDRERALARRRVAV